jgi:two-component system, OmpR family, sensor histidine kinase KdpD
MGRILRDKHPVTGLIAALLLIALLVGSMAPFREAIGLLNVALVLLLASLLIAATWGRQVGLLAALIANLSFNFFFIEPLHTLTVQEPRNVIGLVAFLAVSAIGGTLLAAARTSEIEARRRQTEAEAVLALSRSLSREVEPYAALQTLCCERCRRSVRPAFRCSPGRIAGG